jgi:hypothetical protein
MRVSLSTVLAAAEATAGVNPAGERRVALRQPTESPLFAAHANTRCP